MTDLATAQLLIMALAAVHFLTASHVERKYEKQLDLLREELRNAKEK